MKEAQLGEYKKELRAWKERKAQRDKEKEHLKEQGLTWVSDEDDYAPPPPPPLFHARGGSVHHDKPWVSVRVSLHGIRSTLSTSFSPASMPRSHLSYK